MSAPTIVETPHLTAAAPPELARRCDILIEDQALIPGWVNDLEAFRQWMRSAEFPKRGLIAFLQGFIWVDLSLEELVTHNRVKTAFWVAVGGLAEQSHAGSFVGDRMRWTNLDVGFSTEPDGLYYTWPTVQSNRLRFVQDPQGGIFELEGTPDMVLEIVSASSVNKDTVRLRDLYWRAGVAEYWLVDARGDAPQFQMLRHTPEGYAHVEPRDGWLESAVFGRSFQFLTRGADPEGNPQYVLKVRLASA